MVKHICSLLRLAPRLHRSVSTVSALNPSLLANRKGCLLCPSACACGNTTSRLMSDNRQPYEEDDNDRALRELDVTLLKPHPEWRNSAAGPIFRKNFHDVLWGKWKAEHTAEHQKKEFDDSWQEYVDRYGFTPTEYFDSSDFHERYEGRLVWKNYVRNKKGAIQKQKTRWHCMKELENGELVMNTGSPCPLCRDEHLLLTYNNIPLLKQFIDEQTGEIQHPLRTGACRVKHMKLERCIQLAKSLGYLPTINYFYNFNEDELTTKHAHAL